VGTGTLRETDCPRELEEEASFLFTCYRFTIEDLGDAEFYGFHVRRHGSEKFKREDLERDDWRVSLSL
jgi:hypothetical protein